MRAMHDAIMVGIGTAKADDPLMTVRAGLEGRKPCASFSTRRPRCRRAPAGDVGARTPFCFCWRAARAALKGDARRPESRPSL